MGEPKRTPLYDAHVAAGGKIVDFSGWALPVNYKDGILAEHHRTRKAASLFDVSHMGELIVRGNAVDFVQRIVTNDVSRVKNGRSIVYSPVCYEDGGTVDDLIVYPYGEDELLLVVNAGNIEKDFQWFASHAPEGTTVENLSDRWGEVALQGPASPEIMKAVGLSEAVNLRFFTCGRFTMDGIPLIVSRSGYTGEDGFELYAAAEDICRVWDTLLSAGEAFGLAPAGLGARDTLRFEADLPLYGHELSPEITPIEAALGRFVRMDKGDFIGKDALMRRLPTRFLRGFVMLGRGVPRAGCEIYGDEGKKIGWVTSGGVAPTLGKNAMIAMVDMDAAPERYFVRLRGKDEAIAPFELPFYVRRK